MAEYQIHPDNIRNEGLFVKIVAGALHALTPTLFSGNRGQAGDMAVFQGAATGVEIGAAYYTLNGGDPAIGVAAYAGGRMLAMASESIKRAKERRIKGRIEGIAREENPTNILYLIVARVMLPTLLSSRKIEKPLLAFVKGVAATSEVLAIAGTFNGQVPPEFGLGIYAGSRFMAMVAEVADRHLQTRYGP